MIFFHTYSHSFLLFLSFIPFLSLSLLFSRYISSSQLSSCPCSPPYTSLDRSLSLSFSFYLVSRLTLYLRPAFSLSFIPSLSVRSSQPPPLEFSPFQLPSSPTLSVYTFARFASPAGHPQSSISLSHAHSFSLRLSLSHRFTGVRFAYPSSLRFSLSLSLSLPRVLSIVDLHFSWPFALLLPHECILSGIRRNVLAGVPLITV